ncbi:hypothetical protein [Planococcus sp. S3-L1]|uniref:hypothetical protein n=1 Tax=Planococcus sp. S3-L1 TaxID=3046200 RepID=UPI0024B8DC45|nr:hypothetical protein [Planococcus sp. S3-L1]MDJ0333526.1 hypothetical protein [Planococcus sp. S3-L1]
MKKITTSLTTSALALSLILGASSSTVNASELKNGTESAIQESAQISKDEINQLKTFFNDYDVNQETQAILLEKLNAGELWDSFKKDERPVHIFEVEKNDIFEKVEEYKDGSIIVSSVDYGTVEFSDNNLISPLGITPGTATSGSGYKTFKKAKVYYNGGVANAYFYANFTIVQGGNDYISNAYDPKVTAIGGSASDITLGVTRSKETLDNKASAKLSFNFTNFNNTGSVNGWLKLNVGKDSYSETHSF